MSQPNTPKQPKSSSLRALISVAVFAVLVFIALQYRQTFVDYVHYYLYEPTQTVETIAAQTKMSDKGRFYFYASRPKIAGRTTFNNECQRREADSPVLGCYTLQKIYIFDVTNDKLDGIEQVTAAHEMLHAVYERMSDRDKDAIADVLMSDYKRLRDKELIERMKYYSKNEPGEELNELFSILGTEFRDLNSQLEAVYKNYFSDRIAVVEYHEKSQGVFNALNSKAAQLAKNLNSLVDEINSDTREYNSEALALSARVEIFNERAEEEGGFSTQAEFDATRAQLLIDRNVLNEKRAKIESNLKRYERLRSELEAVAAESSALNRSIDSNLEPEATL